MFKILKINLNNLNIFNTIIPNYCKNNIITLIYHWERINDLFQLKDGRLSCYSDDQTLNIYKNKNFEI